MRLAGESQGDTYFVLMLIGNEILRYDGRLNPPRYQSNVPLPMLCQWLAVRCKCHIGVILVVSCQVNGLVQYASCVQRRGEDQ